jgi:5-formyltetrahydrofolate cyclo-ligase
MMSADKHAIRQALRGKRRQLGAAAVHAAGAAVWVQLRGFAPYQAAPALIAYIPSENEVSTRRALADSAAAYRDVYLPKDGGSIGFVRWRVGEPLIPGRGGVWQPLAGVPLVPGTAAVAILPLVAWDEHGTRLGRGGGFYDRVFADGRADIVRVGLAYEFQYWPDLPRDPWDVPLHYVITEQRVVRCSADAAVQPELPQKGGLRL